MKDRNRSYESVKRARNMRRDMTFAEVVLWRRLRGSKLGVHFRRQEAIGPYIADFVCVTMRLVVEVDGAFHDGAQKNARRDGWLRRRGYRVLRFRNEDVIDSTELVVAVIAAAIDGKSVDGRHQFS